MSESAEQSKPQKPTSVKILQWLHLLILVIIFPFSAYSAYYFSCKFSLNWTKSIDPTGGECLTNLVGHLPFVLPPLLIGISFFTLFKFTKRSVLVSLILNIIAFSLTILWVFLIFDHLGSETKSVVISYLVFVLYPLISSYFVYQTLKQIRKPKRA